MLFWDKYLAMGLIFATELIAVLMVSTNEHIKYGCEASLALCTLAVQPNDHVLNNMRRLKDRCWR